MGLSGKVGDILIKQKFKCVELLEKELSWNLSTR
jgi:hypothetical protein